MPTSDTELTYWKPSLQLSRALGERNQVRVRFYRDVGQLDFEDFVSAADITSSVVIAGNPDLRPETSWRFEAAGDWRFGEDGAFSVHALSLGDRGRARHRAGRAARQSARCAGQYWRRRPCMACARRWRCRCRSDAELRVEGYRAEFEATDPLTGETRSISEFDESASHDQRSARISARLRGASDYERETEAPS